MTKTKQTKLVSILINNYNYGTFLRDAIDSALAQTYQDCEVIVVDDGSTDGSHEIISSYGNRIIPLFKENGGQATAFNEGFKESSGDIICFLDADDTFSSNKAQRLVETFEQYPNASWCFHPIERVDGQLKTLYRDESRWGRDGEYDLRSLLKRGKLGKAIPFDCLVTSGMSLTRELLKNLLPMPEEIRITSDDYIKYAAMGIEPGYMLMETLACQRLHGDNAYTDCQENYAQQGKILIQTAYSLKRNFHDMSAFADNLYALGWATLTRYRKDNPEMKALRRLYPLSPQDQLKVILKKIYYQYQTK